MALSASMVWEARTTATAANANGGGFKTGATGTDYSQQNAAQYSLTGVTTAAADAILLHASAAADMVGNIAFISAGTNFTVGRYEILSVVVGVSITLDRTATSAAGAAGVVAIGGALSLGSTDDTIFETLVTGNKLWIKNGTYTIGGTVSIAGAGTTTIPITVEGYATARGDAPTGSTRPIFDCGAAAFTFGSSYTVKNMQFTGSAANVVIGGTVNRFADCKFTNTSTTTTRVALFASTSTLMTRCEAVSYRGTAVSTNGAIYVEGCYFHDSDIGLLSSTTSGGTLINSLIANNVTYGLRLSGANAHFFIGGNTFYGNESKIGTGISFITGNLYHYILNNIIYGFATGVAHADSQSIGYDSGNNYFNNTADVSNWTKGTGALALTPGFSSVAEVKGTTATTGASGVLTDATKDFSGVTDSRDFIYVSAGTGVTVGKYLITAHTTTTVTTSPNISSNATADKVYTVTTGHNYGVGNNMKASALPGSIVGSSSTNYRDVGAVQRQEAGGAKRSGFGAFG